MAIKEKEIGAVTINNEVDIDQESFKIGYWVNDDWFELTVQRTVVEREFHARGLARGVFDYNDDRGHELTFEEWEATCKDEVTNLLQAIVSEQLHLEEIREVKEINLRFFVQNRELILNYETKIRSLEKMIYESTNPQVKKAS